MRRSLHSAPFVCLVAALAVTGCEPSPSGSAPSLPARELAELAPFPPPPPARPPLPATPAATPTAAEPTGPQSVTLVSNDLTRPPTPEAGPTFNLRFVGPAATLFGPTPGVRLTPAVPFTAEWVNDTTLALHLGKPLSPSTRVEAVIAIPNPPADGIKEFRAEAHWQRLSVSAPQYRSWAPDDVQAMERLQLVTLNFSEPIKPADLRAHLSVKALSAKAAHDLKARDIAKLGPAEAIPFDVLIQDENALPVASEAAAKTLFVRPTETFRTDRLYWVTLDPNLAGEGGLTIESTLRFVLRGPQPFGLSSVDCYWGECRPGQEWNVYFTRALADNIGKDCISIQPALEIDGFTNHGRHLSFTPKNPKPFQIYQISATRRCRAFDDEALHDKSSFEVVVMPPEARFAIAGNFGVIPTPPDQTHALLPGRTRGTQHLEVREKRVGTSDAELIAALGQDFWFADDAAFNAFGFGPARKIATTNAMVDTVGLGVPVESIEAGKPGWTFITMQPQAPVNPNLPADGQPPEAERSTALVIVTSLSLTVKAGPVSTRVWLTALSDGQPIAGAKISIHGRNAELLWEGLTGPDGSVTAPVASAENSYDENGNDTRASNAMKYVLATHGEDRVGVSMESWQTGVALGYFDIPVAWNGGIRNRTVGLVFTERGIYRPGETIHLKALLRTDEGSGHASLAGKPVELIVEDPNGQEALRRELTLGVFGDASVDFPTTSDARTGTWQLRVVPLAEPGGRQAPGTTSVRGTFRVEAYRAPTFFTKIENFELNDRHLKAHIAGRYFFGAPMADADGKWWLHKRPVVHVPPSHAGYSFGLPDWLDDWENRSEESSRMVDGASFKFGPDGSFVLDTVMELPKASEDTKPTAIGDGGRTWLFELEAEASDADAQVAATRASVRVHPADFYAGIRLDKTFAGVGEAVGVNAIAVTPEGAFVGGRSMLVELINQRWERKTVSSPDNETHEHWDTVYETISTENIVSKSDGPTSVEFKADRSGEFLVRVSALDDKGRKTAATMMIWVSGAGAGWSEKPDQTVPLVAEKDLWIPGETARFMVKSPFPEALAIVTVETTQVLWQNHVHLKGNASFIEIPVTDAMGPNAFVGVILFGNPGGKASPDGALARFGYVQFKVSTESRRLQAAVTADAPTYEPGQKVRATVTLADAEGKPMAGQVTLMAVDESVLALTGYNTPDVHGSVFRERSLAVTTRDTRGLVLARRTIIDEDMKSEWGGGGESGQATRYRSEFATTAAFLPDVRVGPDGKAEVEFELPDNLTMFRLMVVGASDDGRYGKAETRIEVQKPLVVRPGLPRFATSGDVIDIHALVQAVSEKARGAIQVKAVVTGPIAIVGPDTATVDANDAATKTAPFRIKALSAGTATVAFSARHADGTISDAVEMPLPIVHPAPTRHAVLTGTLPGQATGTQHRSYRLDLPQDSDPTLGEIVIEVQNSQLGTLLPALDYVLQYPYGCVEQTTSSTMPLIALYRMKAATTALRIDEKDVLKRIQAGVDRLLSMQTDVGGLGYWPGDVKPHPWGSAWAALALVEASEIPGIRLPPTQLERLLAWVRELTRDRAPMTSAWQLEMPVIRPFAAWVMARAGQAEPANQTALFEGRSKLPVFGRAMLALAIHASKRPEGQSQIQTLLTEIRANVNETERAAMVEEHDGNAWRFTMSSDIRSTALLAMAVSAANPTDPLLPKLFQGLLDSQREGRWYNTQENAFAILALSERIAADLGGSSPWKAEVHLGDEMLLETTMEGNALSSGRITVPMERLARSNGKALSLVRLGGPGNLHYSLHLKYLPLTPPATANDHGLTVERAYRHVRGDKAGEITKEVTLGDLVEVTVTVFTDRNAAYVAVEDPLPAGFEPVLLNAENASRADLGSRGEDNAVSNAFNHADQRDDRVYLFADRLERGRYVHRYIVRATSSGRFTAPGTTAHEMYSPWVEGNAAPVTIDVKPRGG